MLRGRGAARRIPAPPCSSSAASRASAGAQRPSTLDGDSRFALSWTPGRLRLLPSARPHGRRRRPRRRPLDLGGVIVQPAERATACPTSTRTTSSSCRHEYRLYYYEHGALVRGSTASLAAVRCRRRSGHYQIYAKEAGMGGPTAPFRMRYRAAVRHPRHQRAVAARPASRATTHTAARASSNSQHHVAVRARARRARPCGTCRELTRPARPLRRARRTAGRSSRATHPT